jgi:predicted porin
MRKYDKVMQYLTFILILLLSLIFLREASAGEFLLVPSLSAKQEYNDNIYLSPYTMRSEHDFITTLSPQVEMKRKTERLEFSLLGRIDQRNYASNTDLNATDQTYRGSLRYMLTPRLGFTGRGGYLRDSAPDRDILTSGLVMSTSTRNRTTAGFTGDYAISEKTALNLNYDYVKDTWDSIRRSDMETNAVNLGLIHDISAFFRETKARANFGFSHYIFTGMSVDNYLGTIGFITQLNKLWSLTIDGGARYTYSQFNVQTINPLTLLVKMQEQSTYGTAATGQIALSYKGEKTNADFTLSRDLQPAYGRIGTLERTAFTMTVTRRLTYELSGLLSAYYFKNKSSDNDLLAVTQTDSETFNISPGLRYEFTKDVNVESTYTYTRVKDNAANTEADRSLVMIRLNMQHKFFE